VVGYSKMQQIETSTGGVAVRVEHQLVYADQLEKIWMSQLLDNPAMFVPQRRRARST